MEDLNKREKIWQLLSEFYLDTELEEEDYQRIAKQLKLTAYSIEKLKEIDLYEVSPILQLNLFSPAGEWSGFDSDWLNAECYKNYQRSKKLCFRMMVKGKNLLFYRMREKHWKVIEELLK